MPLFALMLAPFAFTMGAFAIGGLLEPMAAALGVSVSSAGNLQTAFALACAVAGPALARLTQAQPRKRLLLLTLGALTALNALSAIASDYGTLLGLRIAAGALGALALPLAIAIAAASVAPETRAKAIATVYAGVALAMLLGIPAGSFAGALLGWEASFWATSLVCLLALGMIGGLAQEPAAPAASAPSAAGGSAAGADGVLLSWRVVGYLGVTLTAFAAMFATVGFIGPIISALTGFGGQGVALVQIVPGLSGLAGLVLGARLAALRPRLGLTLLFAIILFSQAVLVGPLAAGWSGGWGVAAILAGVATGPLALFATAPLVQTRLAEAAGSAATLAFALNGSMVYLGQGVGIALGAAMLARFDLSAAPLAGAILAALGAVVSLGIGLRAPRRAAPAPAQAGRAALSGSSAARSR